MNSATQPQPFKYLRSLLQADFIVLVKNRRGLIISMALPLVILIGTHRPKSEAKLGGTLFLLALAITIGLLSSSIMGYALTVARDRERGVFQRLRVTPAPTWTIMVSRLLVQVLANLATAVVVLIVGGWLYHPSLTAANYGLVLLMAIIGGAVFLSMGQALVGLVKSADTINAVGRILYIALVLLGLLGLSGVLGGTLQTIAKWTPVGAVITLLQSALQQTTWNGHTSLSLLACFGYIIVCAAIGIKWFQWDSR